MATLTVLLLVSALWLQGVGSENPRPAPTPQGGGSPVPQGPGSSGSSLEGTGTWNRPLLEVGDGPASVLDEGRERDTSGMMTQTAIVMETGRLLPLARAVAPAGGEDATAARPSDVSAPAAAGLQAGTKAGGGAKWIMVASAELGSPLQLLQSPAPRRPAGRWRRSWLWNQFFVIEEYRGPEPVLIGRLHSDMDAGDGRTRYTLEGEGVGSVFVVDGNTGNIHVTKALDREEKEQYRLVATATDRRTGRALEPSSEFLIRVQDINDNAPAFARRSYVATVNEMADMGTSIIQVTALDADDPAYGNSARLVYTITHGQDTFSIDAQTGVLRTAVADMDRETQEEYLVVLEAKDMGGHLGGLSGTTTVTVTLADVNDNPPYFRRSAWTFSVSELAAPGVEVGRLTASDSDLGVNAQLDFLLLDTDGAGDTFNITARDREAVIVLNKLLDFETRSSYSFSVEVSNPVVDPRFLRKGPFKDLAGVRVLILDADEPPRFSRPRYRLDVLENCPPVCSVGRVSAVDPDTAESANIRYSIDPQSDPEAVFRIGSDTGFITTVIELDREQEQWHNITVIATQRDNPSLVTRVVVAIETLDQNDNAPELERQYSTAVCDSSATGQVVQVLRAIDRDQGGADSPVHFSIPTESRTSMNLSIREGEGVMASLVVRSGLAPLPGSSSPGSPLLLTLYVPVVLRDLGSGLASTGTVTVTVCPCLQGGMRTEERARRGARRGEGHAVCLALPSPSTSLIFSMVTLLALLACITTLLVVCALSMSLRQKPDSLCPQAGDEDLRENIISYDDEGGGEADTAAFDIAALQSTQRAQHMHHNAQNNTHHNPNIWYTQQNAPRDRTYSWSRAPHPATAPPPRPRPGSAPMYGRRCYAAHTLPSPRDPPLHLPQLAHLRPPGTSSSTSSSLLLLPPTQTSTQTSTVTHAEQRAPPGWRQQADRNFISMLANANASMRANASMLANASGVATDAGGQGVVTPAAGGVGEQVQRNSAVIENDVSPACCDLTGTSSSELLLTTSSYPFTTPLTSTSSYPFNTPLTPTTPLTSTSSSSYPLTSSTSYPITSPLTSTFPRSSTSYLLNTTSPLPITSSFPLNTSSSSQPLNITSSYPFTSTTSYPLNTSTYPHPLNTSSPLPTSSSYSSQHEVRGGGSPPTSLSRSSSTLDDTDSSLPSLPSLSGPPCHRGNEVTPPPDTYSIVGSLSRRAARGRGLGASVGSVLYPGAGPLLGAAAAPPGGREEPPPPSAGETGEEAASLPMRMEDFLNFRLKRVTFDLTQPPYDSLQTYEFEGRGSRAGSLSSLESEEAGEEERGGGAGGGGMAALNQKFRRLVEIIKEREREIEGDQEETEAEEEETEEEEAIVTEAGQQQTGKELQDGEEEEELGKRWDF